MKNTLRRTVLSLAFIVLAAAASACEGPDRLPPTTLLAPVVEMAGIVDGLSTNGDTFDFTLIDGRSFTATRGDDRIVGRPGFGLVILGHDQGGRFLGGFPTQDGLPDDCYVDNSRGIDRGPFIELYEILWRKSPDFVPAQLVNPDYGYPGATRFCFDANGLVSGTVGPGFGLPVLP